MAVMLRIQNVTGVPFRNYEHFQVLRYEPGQYYRTHHDMSERDNAMAAGARVYTFFLYLSDVEEGGETNFPRLDDLDVRPRKGRALLWPSVLSDDPTLRDERTVHQAKAVLKGIKYAANAWVHSFNFRVANEWGCSAVSMTEGALPPHLPAPGTGAVIVAKVPFDAQHPSWGIAASTQHATAESPLVVSALSLAAAGRLGVKDVILAVRPAPAGDGEAGAWVDCRGDLDAFKREMGRLRQDQVGVQLLLDTSDRED